MNVFQALLSLLLAHTASAGKGMMMKSMKMSGKGKGKGYYAYHSYYYEPSYVPKTFTFSTLANGEQEVPPVVTDTTSYLEITVDEGFTMMEYSLFVYDGVLIDRAHLHCGEAGENGQILVEFYNNPAGSTVDGLLSYGVKTNFDVMMTEADQNPCGVNNIASLFAAMQDGSVYLNIHSLDIPDGVNRGQILLFPTHAM